MTAPKWADGLGRLPDVLYRVPRLCGEDRWKREEAGRELSRLLQGLSDMQVAQLRMDLKRFAGWLLEVEHRVKTEQGMLGCARQAEENEPKGSRIDGGD